MKAKIRHVPDFPKAGILFYDVTTLLRDRRGAPKLAIDSLSQPFEGRGIDLVVGIESRGFILGAAVADRIAPASSRSANSASCRPQTIKASYALEYGTDSLEMHRDAIEPGQRVLIVDDLLATGGTAAATVSLVKKARRQGRGARVPDRAARAERAREAGRATQLTTILQY